jgi:hypothetical protein
MGIKVYIIALYIEVFVLNDIYVLHHKLFVQSAIFNKVYTLRLTKQHFLS